MASSDNPGECCIDTLLGVSRDEEGTVVKCSCGRYWRRQKGWRVLGVFEVSRLLKMGRIK